MSWLDGLRLPVIVVTLGPACSSPGAIAALHAAGASLARLNTSHLDDEGLAHLLDAAEAGGFPPDRIVVDLQGGKTRLGWMETVEVAEGDLVCLVAEASAAGPGDLRVLPVDRPSFLGALRPRDLVRIDDGRVALSIVAAAVGGWTARVEQAGTLAARKGLALVDREVSGGLLSRDLELVEVARHRGVSRFALSYANPELLDQVDVPELHAKIEQAGAVGRLEALAAASDALWLCRGDLGAEVGVVHLPALQRRVLGSGVGPLLVAGQVLHHLTCSPRPTRSELCHLADLLRAHVTGFVLSDETAIGPHGPAAVRWIREVAAVTR